MTPENFCYWLQGFFEIGNPIEITEQQVQEIKNHLQLVFKKVTPNTTTSATPFTQSWVYKSDPPITDEHFCSTLVKYNASNRNNNICVDFGPGGSC